MGRSAHHAGEETPAPIPGDSPAWLLLLVALLGWQAWMTLGMFGDQPWRALTSDQPIVSGRHPLHLYHGLLGARAFLRTGALSCFDPSFQSGYPKTPVFDAASRPAELFLTLAGGTYRPAAYKIGLAVCCLLVPFAPYLSARGLGLGRRAALLATLLGLAVWWSRPCQSALHNGDVDLLLAALCALVQTGLLIRFDRSPSLRDWLGVTLAGFLGWFAHPLLFALLLPLFLIYFLSVGARHHSTWSLSLLGGLAVAFSSNFFWLKDWLDYWWLRAPLRSCDLMLPHRTPATLWNADLWGCPGDRTLALGLIVAAVVGAIHLNHREQRAAARLFGLGALTFLVLAVGGVLTEGLARVQASGLYVPALLLTTPLAAYALEKGWRWLARATGHPWLTGLGLCGVAAGLAYLLFPSLPTIARRDRSAVKLQIGLGPEQQRIVEIVRENTKDTARILWEDRPESEHPSRWTALLPHLTGRHFIGGLDPGAVIEHTADGLSSKTLGGRPLDEWTDEDLARYCRRYNVGWVVCWDAAAVGRFDRWPAAVRTTTLGDRAQGCLYRVERPHSFVLKGKARWLQADDNRIVLADVEPDDGEVVLSLHYQEGLMASPGRVRLERELDTTDPIPLLRLRLDAPAARVTLTWE